MLTLPPAMNIFLCLLPTDMRRGFDGLMRMAEEHLQQNVLDAGLFVFNNWEYEYDRPGIMASM